MERSRRRRVVLKTQNGAPEITAVGKETEDKTTSLELCAAIQRSPFSLDQAEMLATAPTKMHCVIVSIVSRPESANYDTIATTSKEASDVDDPLSRGRGREREVCMYLIIFHHVLPSRPFVLYHAAATARDSCEIRARFVQGRQGRFRQERVQ